MSQGVDVVVVGAGPVGLLTALGLAKAGAAVTVIEAEPRINDSPRAAVYFPTTLKILDRLGLLPDVLEVAFLSKSFCFHLLATREVARIADTFPPDSPYPYNAHFGQHVLAQLVLKHFSAMPGAEMRWKNRLVALAQDEDGAALTVETPTGREEIRARWVVGADGARSTVRGLLNLPFEGHTWPERFVATNVRYPFERFGYEPANMLADAVNWAVTARLGKEDLWRVTYAEDAALPESETGQRIAERYKVLLPDLSVPYEVVQYSPYRVHERCAPTFRVGRALLAGDAAHACNPCGGMGLTGGVIDAAALGDVLSAVVAGRAPESALDFYAKERRRVFLEVCSPIATDFKRRMSEKDPARQRADFEEFRRDANLPERKSLMTALSKLVEGEPMPV
jgi:2-polyprenyl-6-methoxyphenol hydroxylase-like FAD-dependent oxidoreductase